MAKPRLNEVRIIGNLGRDPELRYTQGGFAIAELSVAIDNSYFKAGSQGQKGEWINKTAWRKVTAMGDLAEWAGRNLQKGDTVFVNGKEDQDQWKDKQTGENRTKDFIRASQLFLVDAGIDPKEDAKPNPNRESYSGGPGRGRRQEEHPPYPEPDDDIPF